MSKISYSGKVSIFTPLQATFLAMYALKMIF